MPADRDHRPGADAPLAIFRLTPVPTVLRTAGAIGLGMIPLHRLPRSVQIVSVLAPAAVATGVLLIAQRRIVAEARSEAEATALDLDTTSLPTGDANASAEAATEPTEAGTRWVPILVLCGAMGATLAGATYAGIRIDRAIENALRRRNVPAPRLVIGLASGALSLWMDLLENRTPSAEDESSQEH